MNCKTNQIRNLFISLFFLIVTTTLFAQAPKVKFGKPDIEELKMTVYDKDTGAVALVLYNYGEFSLNDYTFTQHTKIKILKKEGYSWADNSFLAGTQYNIKGFTYNLENGQVVATKLEKDQIFADKYASERYNVKFTMPNVRPGSVIEFKINYPGLPPTWNFQLPIPVLWSELYIPESSYFSFNKTTYGYENINTLETNHWYAKDAIAVKEEPYLTTIYNFVSKMEFELQNVSIPGYYKSYTETWDNVNQLLSEDDDFGGKMKASGYLRDIVNDIKSKNLPPYERMKLAYETIQKYMKWNKTNYVYSIKYMPTAFKEQSGNTAEVNLMLIALLLDLDLDAKPVVLSTRGNGILHPANPTLSKLNYVIANVKIDTTNYALDATDPFLPVGALPMRCLNGQGRIFETKYYKGTWYDLKPKMRSSEMTMMELKLQPTGEISGKITNDSKGYAAYKLRTDIQEMAGIDKYIEDYQTDNKFMNILSYKVDNLDSLYKPINIQMNVEMNDNVVVTSDKIFFNPLFSEQIIENPFKSEKRTYPVDFGFLRDKVAVIKIEIPEGYTVAELPKTIVIKSPDNSIKFSYSSSVLNNVVNLSCKFNIGKTIYLPEDYPVLRELYNQIVTKEAEQIVLKKI